MVEDLGHSDVSLVRILLVQVVAANPDSQSAGGLTADGQKLKHVLKFLHQKPSTHPSLTFRLNVNYSKQEYLKLKLPILCWMYATKA